MLASLSAVTASSAILGVVIALSGILTVVTAPAAILAVATAESPILISVTAPLANLALVTAVSAILAVVTDPFCSIADVTVLLLGVPIPTAAPMVTTKKLAPLTGAAPSIMSAPSTAKPSLESQSPRLAGWFHY